MTLSWLGVNVGLGIGLKFGDGDWSQVWVRFGLGVGGLNWVWGLVLDSGLRSELGLRWSLV